MTWKEITTSGDYKNLPDSLRSDIKSTYFQSNIAPGLAGASPEDVNLAFQDWMQTPDDTGEGLARSMLGSAARGFLDPLAAVPEVAGAFTGIESLEEFGGDIRGGIERLAPVNPAQQGLLTDIAGVAGQVGQIVATGGLGAATGAGLAGRAATELAKKQAQKLGSKVAVQGAMGASAVAGGLERADQLGLEGGDRLVRGLLAGGTELATEKLGGFATELGPIRKLLGETVESGFMKPVIRGIATEAGEEGTAEVAGQATDIAMAPETAPAMDLKQIGYSMLLGGAGGAMFGGVEAAIAPKTSKAFMESGAFVPARSFDQLPDDVREAVRAGDESRIVSDAQDNLIGYKPKAPEVTVEAELPYEAPIEIDVDKQLPPEVQPEVEAMVANVVETPETSATAAALAEDTQSGIYDLGEADATANLLTGIPMQQPLGGEQQFDNAQLDGQPIEDVPLQETPLQQEQSSVEAVPLPRELPILPAEPTAQAPEAAVGADAATLEQQWQDSPQFAAAEEAAAAGDMERADAIEAGWRAENQQVSPEPTGAVPTESLPERQPTLRSVGEVAVARDATKPEQMTPSERGVKITPHFSNWGTYKSKKAASDALSDRIKGVPEKAAIRDIAGKFGLSLDDLYDITRGELPNGASAWGIGITPKHEIALAAQGEQPVSAEAVDTYGIKLPDGYTRQGDLYVFNATPPPPQQQQPATPATQETQPEAAAFTTQQPAEETGDAGVTQQRPLSRSKPREAIVFKKPIKTPLGNVIGYSWSSQIIEDVDKDGEAIFRRISNWDEAANNAETGRDIVHRFQILKPDGTTSEVSLESTLGKMTAGDKKTVKAVISAAKRLPFMRAELAELKELQAAAKADYDRSRTLKPDRSKLEFREPDAKWLRERGVKQAYLDGVFLENVEASDLTEGGELKNQYKFWNDNTWKWQGAQIKAQFTDTQKVRMESLERSIKKAESLLKDQNVTVSAVTVEPTSLAESGPPDAEMKSPSVTTGQPVPISNESTTDTKRGQQGSLDVGVSSRGVEANDTNQQSASERLRNDIATLPAKAQAAWTPELLAVADSYYSSGDKKLLDSLTAVQRKRVYANASTAAEQAAYEAAQKAAFALRNPPAATYADAANGPNVFVDSLGEEQLQQAITIRESKQDEPENRKGTATDDRGTIQQTKSEQSAGTAASDVPKGQQRGIRKGSGVERRNSILRQNDGSVIRTGVTQRAAEAARNSYDGVIPGVADTWLGTAAEFQEQHPDGIDWGNGTPSQPDADVEAGVAADGRSYVFIDRVQLLEGDMKRAEQYGTTPQGEAVKRLLRHESFGHRGAMSLPAPLRNRFVDMIASGVIPEAELDYIVNERGYSTYAGWRNDIAKQIMLGEEWLAHKMEGIRAIPQSGPMAQMMDWLRDVWAWLTGTEKAMLPELRDMMREMHRALGALKSQQRVVDGTRASLQQSPLDAEYLAAASKGDSGSDNLIQLLRDAPESERKAVVDAWVQRNPKAAAEMQRMVDEAARVAGFTEKAHHGTPTGGFTEFSPEYQGRTGGRARGGFSFTTSIKAAESYAKSFSDESVALDEAIRVANASLIPHRKNNALVEYFSEIGYDGLPEFYWGAIDSNSEFADSLRYFADGIESIQPDVASAFRRGATILESGDTVKPEIKSVFLRLGESPLAFDATPSTLGEVVAGLDVRGAPSKSAVVSMPDGEKVFYVADPNQIKSADPVTYDSSGAPIPPSQRFQSTSNDIRYSRQGPARAQVDKLTINKTKQRSQANPTLAEYEFLPDEYYLIAEAGKVDEAVTAYAIKKTKPYTKSVKGLLELRDILLSDKAIYDTFGIGATTGQAGLDYITAEAALAAEKLGNPILAETFMRINTAIGTSKGQALAVRGLWVNNPRYSSLMAVSMIDRTAEEGSKKVTDKKLGATTAAKVEDAYGKATEDARDATADAAESETLISEKVLELGAAVQGNPKLSERIKKVLKDVMSRGILLRAMQKMKGDAARKSIIPDSNIYDKMTLEEMEAELARLDKEIASDIDFIEKESEAAKAKTPSGSAKKIINRIINKNKVKKERKKGEPDPVEILYKKDLESPMEEADFVERAKAIGVDAATAMELKSAIDLEITANSLRSTLIALGGDIEAGIKKANEEANKFQKQADSIIDRVVDRMADPPLVKEKRTKAKNPIQEAYKKQLKTPVSREEFLLEMEKINVFEQTADLLFDAAAMDKAAREAIAAAKKNPPTPVETAQSIIKRIEKRAAGSTAANKPKIDRIRLLYKTQLRDKMPEAQFLKLAVESGLPPATAKKFYDAIELEITAVLLSKEARGKSENYDKLTKERLKHLDVDTSALTGLVDKLRREGKIGPLRWRDIMQLPATRQQVIKGTLLDLIKANPQLENLTADEQTQLAEALETVWENERERQFKLQVKRMELAGVAKGDAEKLADSVPRILKLINQGMLTEPAFYRAYGEQFGINGVSDKDRERIMELSAKVYDNPSTSETAKDKQEIVDLLQKYHKLSAAEVLSNVWVAHVLSGVRTQSEMAMGVANGLLSTVKKGLDIIATNRDVESVKAAGAGLGAFFRGLGEGFMQAARYVYTEEPGLIRSDMENINSYLEDGVSKGGISTGRKLRQSENKFARGLGQWLSILERVTTGWDVINYRATYEGTLAMAHKMNQKIYNAALLPTQKDKEALRDRAKAALGTKATPTQISSMVFSDIQDGIHLLGKSLEESAMFEWKKMAEDFTYDAKESAYMVDPTGLGGVFYHGIMSAAQGATAKAKKLRDDSQKELDREGDIGRIEYAFRKIFPPLLYLMAAQSRNIFGVRFIRFTGNKINELISYIPAVGLARIAFEKDMYRNGEMTIKARNVFMNNMIGIALVTLALTKGIEDLEEDDEERGYIVNGPWDNLTPARKSQLMADDFKPNTIAFYDKKTGKWNSWNYISWPSAGILATLGSVSDYKRFTPDKWNDKMLAAKIMSGVYAGGSSFMDISSISQMTELFGRSTYSTDPADKGLEKVTRLASGYLGGFVPRLFKDVDSMLDSSAYKPEKSWEHFAKEMPYLRRSVGAPLRDIFYEKVNVSRTPWSRAFQQSPDDPAYQKLARLNAKGIWLTPPNPENRKVRRGGATRALTEDEAAAYMSETGAKYKEFIMKRGDMLAKMDADRAADLIEKTTARIREIALKRAIARGGRAVTVESE